MSKYKEVVYMIIDELKLYSDDTIYTEEHIIFLLDKYRSLMLKQRYSDVKRPIPESNYQTLCLNLEESYMVNEDCNGNYLKSVEKVPFLMKIGSPSLHPKDYFNGSISLISRDRMRYIGHNKFLQNIIYATIGPDNHVYLKSNNPQFLHLEKIEMTGVFEEPNKAAELGCNKDSNCSVLDREYPLESGLVPLVVQSVLKELLAVAFINTDDKNDANDNLPEVNGMPNRSARQNINNDENV